MANPTFALLSNPLNTFVLEGWEVRHIVFAPSATFVQIEGDVAPRSFRGAAGSYNVDVVAVWPRWNASQAKGFLDFLEGAYFSADARLVLTHGSAFGAAVRETSICVAHDWEAEMRMPSGIAAVSVTLREVA